MDDIAAERDAACEWQMKEKQKPEGPVTIYRPTGNPSDPPERLTGHPVEKSVAERERSHPRRWDQEVPPLHAPPRPSYARPAPLDSYSPTGTGMPPDAMRATAVTQSVSRASVRHYGPMALRDASGNPIK